MKSKKLLAGLAGIIALSACELHECKDRSIPIWFGLYYNLTNPELQYHKLSEKEIRWLEDHKLIRMGSKSYWVCKEK